MQARGTGRARSAGAIDLLGQVHSTWAYSAATQEQSSERARGLGRIAPRTQIEVHNSTWPYSVVRRSIALSGHATYATGA